MPLLKYLGKRLLFAIPQLFGIAFVAFFLLKLIPGDPAPMMLGPLATQEAVDSDKTGRLADGIRWYCFGAWK